jgi:hypothetical protein
MDDFWNGKGNYEATTGWAEQEPEREGTRNTQQQRGGGRGDSIGTAQNNSDDLYV